MGVKAKYNSSTGFTNVKGSGVEIQGDLNVNNGIDVTRSSVFRTSQEEGVSETSGSLIQLKGKREGIYFHLGGNQYISNNAWFDPNEGEYGSWKYETSDSAAFRWGFVGSSGRFDLDYAVRGTEGQIITGSDIYATSGAWGYGLSMSASNGCITLGKQAGPRKQQTWGRDDGDDVRVQHGANATLDITGSFQTTLGRPSPLALAVTGSVEMGCGAPDAYFIFPLHDNASRNALSAIEGMVIYNTQTNKLNFFNGANWMEVAGSVAP